MRIPQTAASFVLLFALAACGGRSVAGTFQLDTAAMAETLGSAMEKDPEAKNNPMATAMLEMVKNMDATLTFKDDGTFSGRMSMSMMGQQNTNDMNGTWKLSGDQLEMTSTDKQNKTETKTGTYDGSKIVVKEDMNGQPVEMVFRRKS